MKEKIISLIKEALENKMSYCDTFGYDIETVEENDESIEVIGRTFARLDDDWVYTIKPRKVKESLQMIIDRIEESCRRNVIEKFPFLDKSKEEICYHYLSEELQNQEAADLFEEWEDSLYAEEGLMFEVSVKIIKPEHSNSGNLEIAVQGLISWDCPEFFWSGKEWKTPEYREVITGVRNLETNIDELCEKALNQIY